MAGNLNIRGLSSHEYKALRIIAAHRGIGMETFARELLQKTIKSEIGADTELAQWVKRFVWQQDQLDQPERDDATIVTSEDFIAYMEDQSGMKLETSEQVEDYVAFHAPFAHVDIREMSEE